MKHAIFSLFLSLFLHNFSFAQLNASTGEQISIIKFEQEHIELGEVKRGETRDMEYTFTNTGKEDLQITFVSSCECTTIQYPRKAIPPGETGKLKVTFDSTEKEESETVDIDVYLANLDEKTGEPIWFILDYSFILLQ